MFKKRKLKLITPLALAIFLFLLFLGPRIYGTVKSNIELGEKISDLKNKIGEMESQNEKLGKFIDNFKKEDYIEKEAKTRLNLKKPGEKVVIIVQEEAKKTEEEVKGKFFDFEKIKEFWQKIKESWSR